VDTNRSVRSGGVQSSIQEHPGEGRNSADFVSGSSDGGGARATLSIGSAPAFGEGNSMLAAASAGKNSGKRQKPKNNIAKSNSSFISRCIVNENMGKRLQDRPADGYFAFANINRAFQWLDLSSPTKVGFNVQFQTTHSDSYGNRRSILRKYSSQKDIAFVMTSTK
jgi:hypothetical protein